MKLVGRMVNALTRTLSYLKALGLSLLADRQLVPPLPLFYDAVSAHPGGPMACDEDRQYFRAEDRSLIRDFFWSIACVARSRAHQDLVQQFYDYWHGRGVRPQRPSWF